MLVISHQPWESWCSSSKEPLQPCRCGMHYVWFFGCYLSALGGPANITLNFTGTRKPARPLLNVPTIRRS